MSTPDQRGEQVRWSRADTLAVTLVTALAVGLRGPRLTTPPFIYSDELFYAREACIYVYRSPASCGIPLDAVSAHPPLGKWLISLGIRALGWQPLGWRVAALIAGTATVVLLYVLARRVLGYTWAATLTAGLLAVDFLHIVQSRIAMLDVFLTLFVIAGFLFVVVDRDTRAPDRAGTAGTRSSRSIARPWLLAAGLTSGAAIATKWIGVLALAGVATLAWLWAWSRTPDERGSAKLITVLRREWLAMGFAFAIAPAIIYAATYVPRINASAETLPWARGSWIRQFARVQLDMLEWHRQGLEVRYVGKTNRYVSPAWSWPLIKRPMTYYSAPGEGGTTVTIRAMGSPLVWWASLVALAYLALLLTRRRSDGALVAVLGFAFTYVPLLVVSSVRSATFIYYMLPAVPFMCLAIAASAAEWPASRVRRVIIPFSVASLALLVLFYPVLVGIPLSRGELTVRRWFHDCAPAADIASPEGWCWE